jgi:hypothetical protein
MFQESGLPHQARPSLSTLGRIAQPLCGANTIIADPHKRAFRTLFYGAP